MDYIRHLKDLLELQVQRNTELERTLRAYGHHTSEPGNAWADRVGVGVGLEEAYVRMNE